MAVLQFDLQPSLFYGEGFSEQELYEQARAKISDVMMRNLFNQPLKSFTISPNSFITARKIEQTFNLEALISIRFRNEKLVAWEVESIKLTETESDAKGQ
jgi:hypothetical protein